MENVKEGTLSEMTMPLDALLDVEISNEDTLFSVGQWLECPAVILTFRVQFPAPAIIVEKT